MKCVVITTKNEVLTKEIGFPIYKTVGELVGGDIAYAQITQLPPPLVLVYKRDAEAFDLRINGIASELYGFTRHYKPILGDAVIMSMSTARSARCLHGLTDEQVAEVQKLCADIVAKYGPEVPHE